MTTRERWQWAILFGLIFMLVAVLVWNAFRPGSGSGGRIPVIDEVLRRQR
jgi:hypothetical protein